MYEQAHERERLERVLWGYWSRYRQNANNPAIRAHYAGQVRATLAALRVVKITLGIYRGRFA